MSEWRPIETAPKDGTPVDLFFSIEGGGDILFYGNGRMTNWSYENGKWGSAHGGLSRLVTETNKVPTHWMPIPPKPNKTT